MNIKKLSIGEKAPEIFNVVIEIPKGSHNKYEYDEKLDVFVLDRALYSPTHYPLDYGFIPETRSEDGDHADALVIGGEPVPLGVVVEARPIAILKMIDAGEADEKILAVQDKNPRFKDIKNLEDLKKYNEHLLKEVAHFFEVYKNLQGKKVEIGEWKDREAAMAEIEKSHQVYKSETK